ncbi:MAG: hypothetical protein A2980_01075 [Candidatus Staskawiczbacteria bacterium RIFCSPLOWO2_01_FULL_33_13]|nr:MAG: hypothetical protein A2980_01075 [Candidatus Staskawiczbacteria bacterium RIFCSPLOWO2_01_FULL_33_13]
MKNNARLIILFFLLVALMLCLFFVYPIFNNIQQGSSDILSYKGKLIFLDAQSKLLDDFKEKYTNQNFDLEKINQVFIDAQNPVDFIKFLEDTAVSSGISADITLDNSAKKKGATESVLVFQLFVKGDFSNILIFSEKLENSPYLIKISTLSIKKQEQFSLGKQIISDKVDATFLIEVVVKNKSI